MAYRGTLEAVHARCEDLAARLTELGSAPPSKRRGASLKEALELESRLRARLVVLEACKLHEIDLTPEVPVAPMIFVSAPATTRRWRRRDTFVVVIITSVLFAAAVFGFVCLVHARH